VFKPDGDSFRRVVPRRCPENAGTSLEGSWTTASSSAPAGAAYRSCTPMPRAAGRTVGVEATQAPRALCLQRLQADALRSSQTSTRYDWGTPAARDPPRQPSALAATEFALVDGRLRRLLLRRETAAWQ
jgi:hypothetical protein